MSYQVTCACGEQLPVTEGMAGLQLTCACGRSVTVPSRGELREQLGLPAYEPTAVQQIEHMLASGTLPPEGGCVRCGNPDAEVLEAVAECEQARVRRWEEKVNIGASAFTLLFGGLVYEAKPGEVLGRDLYVPVPVRACRRCRPLRIPAAVLLLLRVLALALLAVGLVVVIVSPLAGALVLAAAVGAWWLARKLGGWQQTAIKNLLACVPVYQRLLEKYPFARVVWTRAGR